MSIRDQLYGGSGRKLTGVRLRVAATAEPELSLCIPQTPTDFETPSVSGAEISSWDDHSAHDHPEPTPTGPPRQDVLPVSTSTRYPNTYQDAGVSFLETPSTLFRVNSRPTKPQPKAQPGFLARTLSGRRRAPLLEVAVPKATHPLDRAVKPPSSPAPFTSNLRALNITLPPPKTIAIPSKAAKLLGLTPTGLPRMTRRASNSDDGFDDEEAETRSSSSSMCSCLPPRPSFASSPTTTLGRASPTPTLNIRTHSPQLYASPSSSPFYAFREGNGKRTHSPSPARSSSPFFSLRDKDARRSLPDVSTGAMVGGSVNGGPSSPTPSDATRGFWDRVKYTRSASQPEVSGEILSLAQHVDRERVADEGRKGKENEEEVEVLQKKARRMTRDDWAEESERLRQRIRESLGY